jgi:4,5-DOPA dioxygenase extradiol
MGSGNVVHNLRRIRWAQPEGAYDWAERFDAAARERMLASPGDVAALEGHPDYALAAPTPDHFIPLLYIAALAEESGCAVDVLVEGFAYGSVSMTAYALGAPAAGTSGGDRVAPPLPDRDVMPPEQTNL